MATKTNRSIGERQIEAVKKVIEYLWDDEGINFESCGPRDRRNHIFVSLRKLDKWLAEIS
jgi:hypothetical protein